MVLGFKTHIAGKPTNFVEKIWACASAYYAHENIPKIHTIRRGKRWKAGMKIHMAIGVRTKDYHQFNAGFPSLQTCISTQDIIIISILEFWPIEVWIDSRKLSDDEICELARNDGFDSLDDFKKYFNGEFEGQIVHWTDKRY